MSADKVARTIEANAELLGITIRPEWLPGVARFYEVAQQMAQDVIESGALTEVEAASIFTPRGATEIA